MMQLLATMARVHSFYSKPFYSRHYFMFSLCVVGESDSNNSDNLGSTRNHVQFLPPAAQEATHTPVFKAPGDPFMYLFGDLNNIENNN